MFNKTEKKLTLEEKVDLLLKYQKQARFWAAVRGVFGFTMFMVFVVLPIVATIYLWDTFSAYMKDAMGQYQNALNGMQSVGEAGASVDTKALEELMQKMGLGEKK